MFVRRWFIISIAVVLCALPVYAQAAAACPAGRVCLDNPLQANDTSNPGQKKDALTATDIIGTVISGALGIVGALTFAMFIWGGWLWLSSAGNTEKIEQGTQTMMWAAVGVVLVFASYIILKEFIGYLTGAQ